MHWFTFFKFIITKKFLIFLKFLRFLIFPFFSESVELEMEDISGSEILFKDEVNVKVLDNNEKEVANSACFRSLDIYFFATIVKTIVIWWFLKSFENVFIACYPLPIFYFAWNGFWITVALSCIFVHHQF